MKPQPQGIEFASLAAHCDVVIGPFQLFASLSVGEVIGRLPSENPTSDYIGRRARLVQGWLKKHRAGKSRDHPQLLSSSH